MEAGYANTSALVKVANMSAFLSAAQNISLRLSRA